MLFFKKILTTKSESTAEKEKRLSSRYDVAPDFPLKATVRLIGRDDSGRQLKKSLDDGRDWGGRLANASSSGLSVNLAIAATGGRGDPSLVKLSLGDDHLTLPCEIAHFRTLKNHVNCGLALKFPDDTARQAYLQLLEPISAGATLAPMKHPPRSESPDFTQELYEAGPRAKLCVWRAKATGAIHGFDCHLGEYALRWAPGMEEIETARLPAAGGTPLSAAQKSEVHWLFCLTVMNLGKGVAQDARDFLRKLVS